MNDFIFGGKEEVHPNTRRRSYHIRNQLINKGKFYTKDSYICENEIDFLRGTNLIVSELMSIRGITNVSISPYEFGLARAEAFTWEEILPQVKRILAIRLQINGI